MNLLFKPFFLNILIAICLALFFTQVGGYFIKSNIVPFVPKISQNNKTNFDITNSIKIIKEVKIAPKVIQKVVKTAGEFLLKDFSISGIILDGTNSIIIVRDSKGGNFMQINDIYKGYKLLKVYPKKAKFSKGIDIYFAFLTPELEKSFKGIAKQNIVTSSNTKATKKEIATGTISKSMFDEIKYKKGKYFIPKDILMEYSSLNKIFSGISIQAYNINGRIKFKVNYISTQSVFAKMGLRKYDFITQINNKDFKSMSEPIKYFQNLQNIEELSLTIQRKNETKELKYEIY